MAEPREEYSLELTRAPQGRRVALRLLGVLALDRGRRVASVQAEQVELVASWGRAVASDRDHRRGAGGSGHGHEPGPPGDDHAVGGGRGGFGFCPDHVDVGAIDIERRGERGHDQRQAGARVGDREAVGKAVQARQLAPRRPVERAARQQRGDVVRMRILRLDLRDDAAVAQHDDAVGDPEHLADVAARQQHRNPGAPHPLEQTLDLGGLSHADRGRRLVQHQQARLANERHRQRQQPALAAGQRADELRRVGERDLQVVEDLGRASVKAGAR